MSRCWIDRAAFSFQVVPLLFFCSFRIFNSLLSGFLDARWGVEHGYSGRVIPTATRARSPSGFPVPNNLQRRESRVTQKSQNTEHRTQNTEQESQCSNRMPSRASAFLFSLFCFSLFPVPLASGTLLVACGGVFRGGTVRGHGWPRRAYRDVFTACPGPEHTAASTRHDPDTKTQRRS